MQAQHHHHPEPKEEEEEEESKEIGLISKKLGIAREVITIISESFNKAAHDLELVNVIHDIRTGHAEPGGERVSGSHSTKDKSKDNPVNKNRRPTKAQTTPTNTRPP